MQQIEIYDIFLSLLRWFIGLTIGCILGLVLALLGNLKFNKIIFKLLNDFLRAIPILGLVPVIQMNIGINEYGKIGLIAWAVMFVVWITVRNSLEKKLESVSLVIRTSNISPLKYFKLFTLPKILGGFLKGIELAIGIAWLAVVAAEWIGTFTQGFWAGGLGYKLLLGYELNSWNTVHLGIVLFGFLGLVSAYSWRISMYFIFQKSKKFNPLIIETTAK